MRNFIILLIIIPSLVAAHKRNGYCSGGANCTACSSCSYCGHCNSGGSCSVCRPDLYITHHPVRQNYKPVKRKTATPHPAYRREPEPEHVIDFVSLQKKYSDSFFHLQFSVDSINEVFRKASLNAMLTMPYLRCKAIPEFNLADFLNNISNEVSRRHYKYEYKCNFAFDIDTNGSLKGLRYLNFAPQDSTYPSISDRALNKIVPYITECILNSPSWIPGRKAILGRSGIEVVYENSKNCSCDFIIKR